MRTTRSKQAEESAALVILGVDSPYTWDGVVYMRTVSQGLDALLARLQKGTPEKLLIHAWAPVKDVALVKSFIKATGSVKGAHIHGHWYRAEQTDIVPAIGFINGDVAFSGNHRLAYLKDAVVTVPEMEAQVDAPVRKTVRPQPRWSNKAQPPKVLKRAA